MQTLIIDTGQKKGKHAKKHEYLTSLQDYEVIEKALKVGDYMVLGKNTSIDTKRNIQELAQDAWKDHSRFKRELVRAKELGVKLIILTETKHVKDLDELSRWREPNDEFCRRGGRIKNRVSYKSGNKQSRNAGPRRIYGSTLAKACNTMEEKYGCEFRFCKPSEAGETILNMFRVSEPSNLTLDEITGRARSKSETKDAGKKDISKDETVELQRIEVEKLIEDFFKPRKEEQK